MMTMMTKTFGRMATLARAGMALAVVAGLGSAPVQAQTLIETELRQRIDAEGVEAGISWYQEQQADDETGAWIGDGPDALLVVGDELREEGRGRDVLALGHMAIELHPDDVRLHRLHGDGHLLVEETREAVQAYQRALEIDEAHQPAQDRLAELWGAPAPRPLGDLVAEANDEGGFLAARDRFFALKRGFDQTGAYDFSPSGVLFEVRRLLEEDRMNDALLLAEVNRAVNRYTSTTYLMAGEVGLLGPDPLSTSFSFRGARTVHETLEERGRSLQEWMAELHERQPAATEESLRVEMDHARAHVVRGEDELARDIYRRILEIDPTHREAREGLRLVGGSPPDVAGGR